MKLVATDLDGTVVRADGTISPRTLAAFAACADAGIDVVFVTGRPPRWLGTVIEQTGHTGTAVCSNGALVYDLAAGRVVSTQPMSAEVVLETAARVSRLCPGTAYAVERPHGFGREAGYVARYDAGVAHQPQLLTELAADGDVVKLLCRNESSNSDAMLAAVREALEGLVTPTHSGVAGGLLEVSAYGVSKAATLAGLAAERGIGAADVIAFGDMPNDIEMLRWAGTGYAMSEGHPDAIAAADALAPPCADDGVAQVIEWLLER